MGNAPLSPLRGTYPRRGKFALRLLSCSISCSRHHAAKISPSGGDAAVGGRRGAFPAPVRAVVWFSSRQERGCKGFIILAPQAPTTTLTAEGRVKPLNPLHLLNPHARQGVTMQAPKGGAATGGIYTGAAGAHHNPHGRRPCQTFEPFAPFEPSRPSGRVHAGAHHNPHGRRPCQTFEPFAPSEPSGRQGASPSTAHAVPLPHRWGRQVLRETAHFPIDGGKF